MEEDIKIIEEFIEAYRKAEEVLDGDVINAIENLIVRYKELEIINKMQEYRISVIDERELIPKSEEIRGEYE